MKNRFMPFVVSSNDQLMAAASGSDTPIDQQLADAFNANNDVLAYVNGLANSSLPALSPEPEWYAGFSSAFADAKIHAMDWFNTITPGLVSIPAGIANYASVFSLNMITMNQNLDILKANPADAAAKNAIADSLSSLLQGLSAQISSATDFKSKINQFSSNLENDAEVMRNAVANAEETEKYDKDKVESLKKKIADLKQQVKTWQVVETAAGLAAGVGFFAGAVIAIFTFGAGLAFGVIAATAGIATIIAASVEIKNLSAEIQKEQAEMGDIEQQISTLQVLESALNDLIDLSAKASSKIDLILQAWSTLQQEISAVIQDLTNADADLSNMDLEALSHDLNMANDDWKTLQKFATTIAGISYNQATPPAVNLDNASSKSAA
ncbi:HBL/NHE enterotoxin family protein [Gilvimarinus sp. DA14]|uniref:HBL/NHE enterotoxin family protein n=1 Tax=Gilvimarinus sp. DA14 TaxID=2956798 RepID=UPI0020B866A4|nr:HBL/NHE enterotoxin family protein [Gilvimarinus sp. DA14]UTF58777.1 HBL/NHE enterotoxin family protein [Gilvimarinus sp. DA14]